MRVRSAIAPAMIVAAVPANTIWNSQPTSSVSSKSTRKKPSRPMMPDAAPPPIISAKPNAQKPSEAMQKSRNDLVM